MEKTLITLTLIVFIGFTGYFYVNLPTDTYPDTTMQQDTVLITGRIFVGGHEPFTTLALEREDGTAIIISAEDSLYKELWTYQNQILTCKGTFDIDPLHGKSLRVIEFYKKE